MEGVSYFEIPVSNLDRAVAFYERVFGVSLERTTIDGYRMALFPTSDGESGASGALAEGDVYRPTRDGVILYFTVGSIDDCVARALEAGGHELYPKKQVDDGMAVGEIGDSEGNRIGLVEYG